MTKFEERLWSLIRNFVELGHNNPAMLVAAVRIVEIQEMVDKQLESSGQGKCALPHLLHACMSLQILIHVAQPEKSKLGLHSFWAVEPQLSFSTMSTLS